MKRIGIYVDFQVPIDSVAYLYLGKRTRFKPHSSINLLPGKWGYKDCSPKKIT